MLRPYSSWLDSRGAGNRCRRAPVPAIGTACYTRPFVPRRLRAAAAPLLSAIAPAGVPAARGRRIANRATTAVPGPRRRHVFDAEERGSPARCRAGQRRLWRLLPDLRTTTPIAVGTFGAPSHALYPAVAGGEVSHIGIVHLVGETPNPAASALFERAALPGARSWRSLSWRSSSPDPQRQSRVPGLARGEGGVVVAARLDGLHAPAIALLVTDGLVGMASYTAWLLGHHIPLGAEKLGTGLRSLGRWAVPLAVRRHPRGARRAPWPRAPARARWDAVLARTVLVALPLAGRGPCPFVTRHGQGLVASVLGYRLAFGVALGKPLPRRDAARLSDPRPHHVPPGSPAPAAPGQCCRR